MNHRRSLRIAVALCVVMSGLWSGSATPALRLVKQIPFREIVNDQGRPLNPKSIASPDRIISLGDVPFEGYGFIRGGKPMAPETWKAIQKMAARNAGEYDKAFLFTPRNQAPLAIQKPTKNDDKPPASLWPVWKYNQFENHNAGGKLAHRMPFEYAFWRKSEDKGDPNGWEASACAPEAPPKGVQGFIVDLPVDWTRYEQNNTGFNVIIIASSDLPALPDLGNREPERQLVAQVPSQPEGVDA